MAGTFLERVAHGPLVCDGGYYLELERRLAGSYKTHIPMAVLDHPESVLELHREFARAGADVLQAMAWGVTKLDREAELHRAAVELAREAAGPDRFVAGTLSPRYGGKRWQPLTNEERVEVQRFFDRRVEQQVVAGVDLFIVETFISVEEASLALPFLQRAKIPSVVTLAFQSSFFTREGYTPGEGAQRLQDAGADVVGVNCNQPPHALMPVIRQIRAAVTVPICAQPTAYELEPGETYNRALAVPGLWTRVEPRVVTRYAMALYAVEARAVGVGLIGACCGALPYHVRAIAEALGKPVGLPDSDRGYEKW